jgi:hypothetical protein
LSFDVGRWSALADYVERVGKRPAVQEALRVEAEAAST